jgi:hypothetical protein
LQISEAIVFRTGSSFASTFSLMNRDSPRLPPVSVQRSDILGAEVQRKCGKWWKQEKEDVGPLVVLVDGIGAEILVKVEVSHAWAEEVSKCRRTNSPGVPFES